MCCFRRSERRGPRIFFPTSSQVMPGLQVHALTPAVLHPVQYTVCSHGYVEMSHKEGSERAIWASGGLGGCWLISTNQWAVPRDPWDSCEDPRDPGRSIIRALSFGFTVWRESSFFSSQTSGSKNVVTGLETTPLCPWQDDAWENEPIQQGKRKQGRAKRLSLLTTLAPLHPAELWPGQLHESTC